MADETKKPKALAEMTGDEILALVKTEDAAHKKRMTHLRALAKAVGTTAAK